MSVVGSVRKLGEPSPAAGWGATLSGDDFDLERLSELFAGSKATVARQETQWTLTSVELGQLREDEAARAQTLAEGLVSSLNDVAHLEFHDWRPVNVGHVYFARANGTRNIVVNVKSASIEMRTAAAITAIGPDGFLKPTDPSFETAPFHNLMLENEDVGLALSFVRIGTWASLYKALDLIESHFGGEKQFERLNWAPLSELKRFTHTANSMDATGMDARHAKRDWKAPPEPMTLPEARDPMRSLVLRWLAELRRTEVPGSGQ